ncbi:hypothetical protein [Massilia sp. TSP1-1-2]|uniref:hypothetical protein n=1 Tax=unclassified Massilia TaxID=2609279 RepID=UPI003CE6E4EB
MSVDLSKLASQIALFKGQGVTSLFDKPSSSWEFDPLGRAAGDARFSNGLGNALFERGGASDNSGDPLAGMPSFGNLMDQFSASLRQDQLPTSTTPTALDAAGNFSRPGQNMVTVLNRVEVTFKAQFSELGEMRHSLVSEQAAAKQLGALGPGSSAADIKAELTRFVSSYNAGVNRFAPAVDKGGILEGSWEAGRARFATRRDIGYSLNGADVGIKGDLAQLGITTDPKTGLAAIDDARLDGALTRDRGHVLASVTAFANTFVTTVDFLNAKDHGQQRQMANLDRAVHWIGEHKAAVQKEFGAGAAATPNAAFAKAAAHYDEMARLDGPPVKPA